MFIGRTNELRFLNTKYQSNQAELVVLYGRRRIGKTELLKQFSQNKECIFHACREVAENQQLQDFSQALIRAGHPAGRYISSFKDWGEVLEAIVEVPTKGKRLLIIDEFPYLARSCPAFASTLQNLWDHRLCHENLMIVLCGSSMSFIEKEILSEKNPLYGRASGILKLQELRFSEASKFVPNYTMEDKMATFAILGGVPYYLKRFNQHQTLEQNVIENILQQGSVLYSEVDFLLRQELRETATYNTIIEAIALGNTKLSDLAAKTQISKTSLMVYLKNLIELGLVKRELPVSTGIKEHANIHRGLYTLDNNFFRFWYRFVFSNRTMLEFGDASGVWNQDIEGNLNDFTSKAFEEVCIEYLLKENQQNQLDFRIHQIGRWWFSNEEIDIVASGSQGHDILLGECKYRQSPTSVSEFRQLEQKSQYFKNKKIHYFLFSKSGFTQSLQTLSNERSDIHLINLSELG